MSVKRALISVYDKTGLVDFAHELHKMGIEIFSTGGTAKTLKQSEIHIREVSELTGFPEILDGRVKTLHPKIFGALLAKRSNVVHERQLQEHAIEPIDLVVVNLYPFTKAVLETGITEEELVEYIDIGGVSLLRAAAKNFPDVVVVCDPGDYTFVAKEIRSGNVSLARRRALAAKAFTHTAFYDSVIAQHFRGKPESFPPELSIGLEKVQDLRYGENPHQQAALYKLTGARPWGVATAKQLHGKELSFNNYLDLEAAWETVSEFDEPACVIVKHTNPCGVATLEKLSDAYQAALACDPQSAFGGIVGFNREVDHETAQAITKIFTECIIAPHFSGEALEILKRKKDLRLLEPQSQLVSPNEYDYKHISGGLLVQEKDNQSHSELKVVTKKKPTQEDMAALQFAWKVVKHVKSNGIVLASGRKTMGIGAGQMSRVDSLKTSVEKAKSRFPLLDPKERIVLASDAFFPFRDNVDEAAKAGIVAIIQPGGSIRDQESIDACNEHGIAMVFTSMRHFKH